ncbi:MAG TPA: 5-methyltetrahydropteroyltriglutamate--homocysteine S-methyltransferase [Candidatus Dormibacteraeota bacterium]|nr:5-methyltetrahydropteroyltriglutamate--homocysteine S-methyltransferase [Candidatus Dormibacteraeota bacterium]
MAAPSARDRKGPFRAEHVGSLLRSERLLAARERAFRGELTAAALRAVEDQEICRVIDRQEAIGLQVVTDGEFRRTQWHFDFFVGLEGVEFPSVGRSYVPAVSGTRVVPTRERPVVVGRVGFSGHPMVEHFTFLRQHTTVTPKISIPAPSVLHFRNGRVAVPEDVYPDLDEFFEDLGHAYGQMVRALADAGCHYLQLDETSLAYLCDPEQRRLLLDRGDDPDDLVGKYVRAVNLAVAEAPDDMTVAMHLCRGNNRSNWHASGGYEPIAEVAFNQIDVDGYLLEYDSDRAGGFEPLRHLPSGKRAVLGLLTSKFGALEDRDEILRRIEAASRYVDVEQLGLSPQCGFASIDKGNLLTEAEQWRKLELVVEVAEEVWG